ncbi:MAG: hypothetical protein NVSMB26_29380 [Beijerinckiaceae bacterium]
MSGKGRGLRSDLPKVDAHVIRSSEYEEVPELDSAFFEGAELHEGGKRLNRGGSSGESPTSKQDVTLSIDRDVLERFRATGTDWPDRMNQALRKAAKLLS